MASVEFCRKGGVGRYLPPIQYMHAALRKAGVEADLYVGEAMPHGGLGLTTPEDADARADTLRWLKKHWISA
jgi:monoterpene epsilon-lactone hydrolase